MDLTKDSIIEKIDKYNELKKQISELEKITKPLSSEIKNYLMENKLDSLEGNTGVVTLSKSESSSYIDFLLIENLKKLGRGDLIKTKEYVDTMELEREIYNNKISSSLLKNCKQTDVIYKLNRKDKKL